MYNRYIGNTGKFYRVEEPGDIPPAAPPAPEPDEVYQEPPRQWVEVEPERVSPPLPPPLEEAGPKLETGGIFNMPGSLRETIRDKLPAGLDLGDILLVLVLLYLFLESDDDDMLIILGVLLFTWIWPLFKSGD
ncbi:MAG: hypothetical protein FWC72_01825 [Oscillospiraceae bacterium]|nr:hypothetical protein [Oscillospiraceae bacterium]